MGTEKRGRLPPSHHTLLVESFGLEDSRFVFLLLVRFKFHLTVVGKVPRRYKVTS